jgi:allophanate hydrolase
MPSSADDVNDVAVVACGDDLLGVATASAAEAQALAAGLRDSGDWRDAVGGIDTVVAQFDPTAVSLAEATARLKAAAATVELPDDADCGQLTIPVVYDGEDLERVCEQLGLSRDAFIELHTRDEYRVDMLGFVPGFAYVGGLDPALDVPRLENPRQRVPAGSVGIAGGRTGLYALDSPGGWPIVGRTTMPLFDARADDPFVLRAGMRIRFEVVDGDTEG